MLCSCKWSTLYGQRIWVPDNHTHILAFFKTQSLKHIIVQNTFVCSSIKIKKIKIKWFVSVLVWQCLCTGSMKTPQLPTFGLVAELWPEPPMNTCRMNWNNDCTPYLLIQQQCLTSITLLWLNTHKYLRPHFKI